MTTESGTAIRNPAGTSHAITYWELWNEPDLNNETPCAPSNGTGITPAQYQLLLAIRGHSGGAPTIGEVAEHLLLRHHSVVGLVDRAAQAGLVERHVDAADHRAVRLALTPAGARRLATLAAAHIDELSRAGGELLPRFDPAR